MTSIIKKYSGDFRTRTAVIAALSMFIFFVIFAIFGYGYYYNTLRDATGTSQREMARLMAGGVSDILYKEIELMKFAAASEMIYEGVKEADLKYPPDEQSAQRYLEDMDKKWVESQDNHPLIKSYLENKISSRLKSFLGTKSKIVNILVVDKFGGLVGSSARTADFYQGNKEWCKRLLSEEASKAYAGGMVYDEKLNVWCVTLAVPIRDKSGELAGLYCSLADISIFFKPLEDFKIGETGKADLVDDKCYLVYQQGVKPFANKFCNYEDMRKMQEDKRSWFIMDGVYSRPSRAFVASAAVDNKLFTDGGINWRVFVTQDAGEVFAPLNKLLKQAFVIGIVLVLAAATAAFKTADVFMGPIRRMKEGVDRIAHGELGHRIESDNETQLKGLADSINNMVGTLKSGAAPIANLDKEIHLRSKAEEKLKSMSAGFAYALSRLTQPIERVKEGFKLIFDEMQKSINEKQKKSITTARESMDTVSGSLDKLLDVANIEAGKIELNKRSVDIRSVLRDMIFIYEPKIREKGLDFRMELPKDPVNVFVDPAMIAKVFSNLMENAVRLTEKGYIELAVREQRDEVECSITDTGPGMPKEHTLGAFEKYQNVKGDKQKEWGGPGVGLAIAREIIEMHNGTIWVNSEIGKTTKFAFKLAKYKKT